MNDAVMPQSSTDEYLAHFRLLMKYCVDGMIIIDGTGLILEFNPAAEEIFGYVRSEIVGRNVSMLMPEPDRSRHDGYLRNYMQTGRAKIIGIGREVIGERKDGSTFSMDLSVGELPIGVGRYFIGTVRDITERQTIESQLLRASKMEAVGQLTGGIAHDFNNLLAILMMDLEMLQGLTGDNPGALELVEEALEVTRTGADLTQRLLAFSRRQPLMPSQIDVGELITTTAGLLRRSLGEAVEMSIDGVDGLWPISVDRAQLENALVNLAINARDAMVDGGRLSIDCANVTIDKADSADFDEFEPGHYVRVSVSDNGTGMPPEIASRVFEPFFTTKEGGHGTGLGLSMVYGFARQSGGHVSIYSEAGHGTTVNLYFPREGGSEDAAEPIRKVDDYPTGNERILLVEDDTRLRERTERALTTLGYRVEACESGREAQDRIDAGIRPDLLLTDIVMPGGVSGTALAEHAAKALPSLRIILMTGYADNSEALMQLAGIGAIVLNKPFTRRQLAESIRSMLD